MTETSRSEIEDFLKSVTFKNIDHEAETISLNFSLNLNCCEENIEDDLCGAFKDIASLKSKYEELLKTFIYRHSKVDFTNILPIKNVDTIRIINEMCAYVKDIDENVSEQIRDNLLKKKETFETFDRDVQEKIKDFVKYLGFNLKMQPFNRDVANVDTMFKYVFDDAGDLTKNLTCYGSKGKQKDKFILSNLDSGSFLLNIIYDCFVNGDFKIIDRATFISKINDSCKRAQNRVNSDGKSDAKRKRVD